MTSLKIEEGKFYRTRSGKKVGPMRKADPSHWDSRYSWEALPPNRIATNVWTNSGRFFANGPDDPNDLIAEWQDTPEFKVGDRVRLKFGFHLNAQPGATAVVTSVGRGKTVNVQWDRANPLCRRQMDGGYFTECFELIGPPEPSRPGSFIVVRVYGDGRLGVAANPHIHDTREKAEREAKRLADLIRGVDFRVYSFDHLSTANGPVAVKPPVTLKAA